MKNILLIIIYLLIICLNGCASFPDGQNKTIGQTESISSKSPFYIFYIDTSGFNVFNSNTHDTKLLIPLSKYYYLKKISSDNHKIALSYFRNDSTLLSIIDTKTYQCTNIFSISGEISLTFEFSPNCEEIALGYYYEDKNKKANESKLLIYKTNGEYRQLNCSSSNSVEAWLPDGNLAVSDLKSSKDKIYIVDNKTCKTTFSIDAKNKRNIRFSPDGKKLLYYEIVKINKIQENRIINVPELFVQNINGNNKEKISGYKLEPQNATWSPNSNNIAYEISSQEWSNIKNIALYDCSKKQTINIKREDPRYGLPKSEKPVWSPNGNQIIFSETFYLISGATHTQDLLRNSLINIAENEYSIITEEMHSLYIPQEIGNTMMWIDDNSVLLSYVGGDYRIIDTNNKEYLTFPPYSYIIHVVK